MPNTTYKLADIKKHSTKKDLWMVIHGKVYDVTKFIDEVCSIENVGVLDSRVCLCC